MDWARLAEVEKAMEAGHLDGIELVGALTTDGTFLKRLEGGLDPGMLDSRRRLSALKLLARGAEFDNSDLRQTIIRLLGAAIDHKVIQKSADSLLPKIMALTYRPGNCCEALVEELGYLLVILRECLSRMLSRAVEELLPHIEMVKRLGDEPVLKAAMGSAVAENLKRFKVVAESMHTLIATREEDRINAPRKTRRQLRQEECERMDPPEDYRELSIVPTADDVLGPIPYLRRNVIKGPFKDENHCLDVHFRLLREDYIHDLRKGIAEYTPKDVPGKRTDLRIYRGAKIEAPKVDKSGIMLSSVHFDIKPFRRMNWESGKRLIYGSLLCFSSDGFKADLVFAVVKNSDAEELKKGCIDVMFENPSAVRRERTYVMAETSAYFESYRHILEGLKRISAANFPFKEHLVECNSHVPLPQYMGGPQPDDAAERFGQPPSCINFAPLINPDILEKKGPWKREVGRRERWPRKEEFGTRGLDESQFEALFHALNHRIAIIQGPPGTGKTFIGLQIMRLLLDPENQRLWNPARVHQIQENGDRRRAPEVRGTPILVVCYTNHALDQFLEGIIDFNLGKNTKLIRIGGRSKVARLADFHLHKSRLGHATSPEIYGRLSDCRNRQSNVRGQLVQRAALIHLLHSEIPDLASFHSLEKILPSGDQTEDDKDFQQQMEAQLAHLRKAAGGRDFIDWLLDSETLGRQLEWMEKVGFLLQYTGRLEHEADVALHTYHGDVEKALHFLLWTPPFPPRRPVGVVSAEAVERLVTRDIGPVHALAALTQAGHDLGQASRWLQNPLPEPVAAPVENPPAADEPAFCLDQADDRRLVTEQFKDFKQELSKEKKDCLRHFLMTERYEGYEAFFFGILDDGFRQQSSKKKKKPWNQRWSALKTQILHTLPMTTAEMMDVDPMNMWRLPMGHRWGLMNTWRLWLTAQNKAALDRAEIAYSEAARALQEIRHIADTEVMRSASVIGMTTTGAARYQSVLQTIKPPIVIVEEAAEVFEAHLLTSLSSGTQHLIMIGDHKQLRPSPAVYTLEKDYHLDISLFERLINNGFAFAQLEEQHRMRPEISGSLMPHFYDNLRDHPDVAKYENVRGMAKDVFFFNHAALEAGDDSGDRSKKNVAEAKMVAKLAAYLRQQDYAPDRITVLACYVGQLFEIGKLLKANSLTADIRIAVVDNYQGEECDIIILSMVRSNNDGKIGFLKTDNRACVALSRAKMGFYCLGNFDFLAKHSHTWAAIKRDLERNSQIGNYFGIKCVNHEAEERIRTPDELTQLAPNGGCKLPCEIRLNCGHACQKLCHANDRDHVGMVCAKPCLLKCKRDIHDCKASCGVDCPSCKVQIDHTLPCGHIKRAGCGKSADNLSCGEPCTKVLPACEHPCAGLCTAKCPPCILLVPKLLDCGHSLDVLCHNVRDASDKFRCDVLVKKKWLCGHEADVACHVDVRKEPCREPCTALITGCGHACSGSCGACLNGRLHVRCSKPCQRRLLCGHKCEETCSEGVGCGPCRRPCETACPHRVCGEKPPKKSKQSRRQCGTLCPTCTKECNWNCGHLKADEVSELDEATGKAKVRKRKCHEPRPRCTAACELLVMCTKTQGCRIRCRGVCSPSMDCIDICPKCEPEEWATVTSDPGIDDETLFVRLEDCGHVLPVLVVDKSVDEQLAVGNNKMALVGLITCPKCKTPIRKSLRYGAAIKKKLDDIEAIKMKQVDHGQVMQDLKKEQSLLENVPITDSSSYSLRHCKERLCNLMAAVKTKKHDKATLIRFRVARGLLTELVEVHRKLKSGVSDLRRPPSRRLPFASRLSVLPSIAFLSELLQVPSERLSQNQDCLTEMERWLSSQLGRMCNWVEASTETLTTRQARAADAELARLALALPTAFLLHSVAGIPTAAISPAHKLRLDGLVADLAGSAALTPQAHLRIRESITTLSKELAGLRSSTALSIPREAARAAVPVAWDLGEGAWLKCPKGHFFATEEAVGTAKCCECEVPTPPKVSAISMEKPKVIKNAGFSAKDAPKFKGVRRHP